MTDGYTPGSHDNQPQRQRRTHRSAAISDALKTFPRHSKIEKNRAIGDRNGERKLQRALHAEDPEKEPDASDDESVITIDDLPDVDSPSTAFVTVIQKLSPSSAASLARSLPMFAALASKRP